MNEYYLNSNIIYMMAGSILLICAVISYSIDAKGRFNYNTYWDDKEASDDKEIK